MLNSKVAWVCGPAGRLLTMNKTMAPGVSTSLRGGSRWVICQVGCGRVIGGLSKMAAACVDVICFFSWHLNTISKVTKLTSQI